MALSPEIIPAVQPLTSNSDIDSLPSVTLENGQPVVTTLQVVCHFGKRHGDKLRAITNLGCSAEISLRNFASSDFVDQRGKTRTKYYITRVISRCINIAFLASTEGTAIEGGRRHGGR